MLAICSELFAMGPTKIWLDWNHFLTILSGPILISCFSGQRDIGKQFPHLNVYFESGIRLVGGSSIGGNEYSW